MGAQSPGSPEAPPSTAPLATYIPTTSWGRAPPQARTHNTSWDPRSILGGALELNQRIMAASTKWLQALWAVMLLVSILPGGVAAENNASARGPFSESACGV